MVLSKLFSSSCLMIALCLCAPAPMAQGLGGGVILPRLKTCSVVVPDNGGSSDGCIVTVVMSKTGQLCHDESTSKVNISVTITCGANTCRDYPTQDNCSNGDTGDFSFSCEGSTIVLKNSDTWSGVFASPCTNLSAS